MAPTDRFLRISIFNVDNLTVDTNRVYERNDKCSCHAPPCDNQTEVQRGDQSDGRGCGRYCGVVGYQAEEEEGEEEAAGCEDTKGPFSVFHLSTLFCIIVRTVDQID